MKKVQQLHDRAALASIVDSAAAGALAVDASQLCPMYDDTITSGARTEPLST